VSEFDRRAVVLGTMRSGTTLVQRGLAALDGVVSPVESHFFDLLGPRLARLGPGPLYHRAALGPLVDHYLASWRVRDHVDADRVRRWLAAAETNVNVVDLFWEVTAALTTEQGEVLVEKTPEHVWWWRALATHPRTRFIVVHRDPREVAEALVRRRWLRWPETAGAMWSIEQAELHRLCVHHPERVLVVRFADVVADGEWFQARAAAFLGLSGARRATPPEGMVHDRVRHLHERTLGESVAGDPDGHPGASGRPGSGTTALRVRHSRRVEAIGAWHMRRLGYRRAQPLRTFTVADLRAAAGAVVAGQARATGARGAADTVAGRALRRAEVRRYVSGRLRRVPVAGWVLEDFAANMHPDRGPDGRPPG
jgi:hypothetical protein